jgi:hypothetical protein
MSAIGREGGHSRGARARAANQGGSIGSDVARTDEQVFERQINTERSGFEPRNNERPRSNERQGDNERANPFEGRGNI